MHMRGPTNKNGFKYAKVTLLTLVASLLYFGVFSLPVSAAELTNRSIVISTSEVGSVASHRYNFRVNTSITVGSLEVEYCTNSPYVGTPCTAPAGFNLAIASMGTQSGLTGFNIDPSTTTNKLILSRVPAGVTPTVNASLTVNNITNPSTPNQTVFVRISTFATNDATGIRGDRGTVAFSTARQLIVNGFVPPYLTFCVANIVAPDCSSTIGNYLDFGELSSSSTRAVTSQFAVATNDVSGYVTTVSGLTLTSGNNTISSLSTGSISIPGTPQFGLNLRANSSPLIGSEKTGVGTGVPNVDFDTPNNYIFKNGNIASSPLSTEFNLFTVSYIANVSPTQPPGVYISTLTYITTVSF
jgi:hypothetical protein